jgi:hypothetical protein
MAARRRSSERKYDKRAGEEVREEMHHMREGKHSVKNREQAIAIGPSKARKKAKKSRLRLGVAPRSRRGKRSTQPRAAVVPHLDVDLGVRASGPSERVGFARAGVEASSPA